MSSLGSPPQFRGLDIVTELPELYITGFARRRSTYQRHPSRGQGSDGAFDAGYTEGRKPEYTWVVVLS